MKNNIELQGKMIKNIFKRAGKIANLHAVLTSPKGDYFRIKLLQELRKGLTESQLRTMRKKAGLHEQARHINKLMAFKLVEYKRNSYRRTAKGEAALNAVKEFERKVGKKQADKIFKASLGENSVQLFLAVYGSKKHFANHFFLDLFRKPKKLKVRYSPGEIGKISRFLFRTIDDITAIDKLNLAGILTYEDDGYIHFSSIKASSFYQYLKKLYEIKYMKIKK